MTLGWDELERFSAKTDAGEAYRIIKYGKSIPSGTLKSPKVTNTLNKWVTTSGLNVKQINATTFEIIETRKRVKKI